MKIAITGGTGFVGSHLARSLVGAGHEVVLISRGVDHRDETIRNLRGVRFFSSDLGDRDVLAAGLEGCVAVAHLAGINREIGTQTFSRVHGTGTRNVVEASRLAGVKKVLLLSFLRARPSCGSAYHESKWEAEEILRNSGLDYTVLKAGVIYGRGDHLLDHLSRGFQTLPLFPLVGREDRSFRPLAIRDMVRIIRSSLVEGRLSRQTVRIVGPEELTLLEGLRRVSRVVGKRPLFFRLPVFLHYFSAWVFEHTMTVPLVSAAQVRMLAEGLVEATGPCEELPADLLPRTPFEEVEIQKGLPPQPGSLGWKDCLWFRRCR